MNRLGLKPHQQKTRCVVQTGGQGGLDFLGCHLHKRMSGRLWQQKGLSRYYLQRCQARKAMNRVRHRVRELTPRRRCHQDVRSVIAELKPVLRGWGQYFCTGNTVDHFIDVDDYVVQRLGSLRQATPMSIHGKAYVVGAFEHPTRKAPDKGTAQLHAECARGALADAGLELRDVEAYFCAGDAPGMGALSMADYLGLKLKHVDSTDTGVPRTWCTWRTRHRRWLRASAGSR